MLKSKFFFSLSLSSQKTSPCGLVLFETYNTWLVEYFSSRAFNLSTCSYYLALWLPWNLGIALMQRSYTCDRVIHLNHDTLKFNSFKSQIPRCPHPLYQWGVTNWVACCLSYCNLNGGSYTFEFSTILPKLTGSLRNVRVIVHRAAEFCPCPQIIYNLSNSCELV